MNAPEILRKAAQTIEDRAAERGEVSERSMVRTIESFNAHWGTSLTEQQGWSFMQHLKAARNISGHKDDDLIDKVAYTALEAECVLQELSNLNDESLKKEVLPYDQEIQAMRGSKWIKKGEVVSPTYKLSVSNYQMRLYLGKDFSSNFIVVTYDELLNDYRRVR